VERAGLSYAAAKGGSDWPAERVGQGGEPHS
jgi:hypothetical protein